jgi:N4-gp56 family major capsid protein
MAITNYASQNFPNGSVNPQYYLLKKVLESADTYEVLDKFFDQYTMPMNSNAFIGMRRYLTLAVDATPTPEGTNKEARSPQYEDFSTQMLRYTERYQFSRQNLDLTPFDMIDANEPQLKKLVTLTRERVRWNAAQTIANKAYNSPSISSIPTVNGPVTASRLQVITRSMLAAKANYFDGIEAGSQKEGTSPTQACFNAICHTDLQPDLDALPGFQQVAYSPTGRPKHITHYGNYKNICFYTSQEAPILTGQGAATTTLLASGGNANVYPILIMGKKSMGAVSLKGAGKGGYGNANTYILDKADKYDPSNAWADLVATWYDAALPTTNDWAWILYVGATANP